MNFIALLPPLIASLGVLLLYILKRYRWLAAAGVIVLVTLITLTGFWPNERWGISDWDYYFSYHTSIYRMVVEQGVFPQWNPYICGGTSGIGDPEFPLFAPTFLFELLFGIPLGFRIAIFAITSFGGIGMLLLARRLKLSPEAGLLAALPFALGSVNLLEIVEGHPNVFSAFYLPWIFWSWLGAHMVTGPVPAMHPHTVLAKLRALWGAPSGATRSLESSSRDKTRSPLNIWTLICGIFLALTFFQGGIYMLMYTTFAFLFLILFLPHRTHSLLITIKAGVWALGLAAIKLVPVLLWLRLFQDRMYASSTYILPSLHKILLGRYLHGVENVIPNQGSGWHEYGAYIGITVLVVALLTLVQLKRRAVWVLWLGALLAVLIASSGPILKPFFDQAPFLPRSNISRFIILTVLPLSLLAGFGLQKIKQVAPRRISFILVASIVGLAAFEITSYATTLSYQAFILNPVVPMVSPPPEPIAYTINQHKTRINGVDFSRAYAGAEKGYGTLSYCSVLGPESTVRVVEDPEGSPYLTVHDEKGQANLVSWAPNRISAKLALNEPGDLTLNSNFAPGWTVEIVTDSTREVRPVSDVRKRLGVSLPAGEYTLTFTYRAPGLILGNSITALTLLAAVGYLAVSRHNKVSQARA